MKTLESQNTFSLLYLRNKSSNRETPGTSKCEDELRSKRKGIKGRYKKSSYQEGYSSALKSSRSGVGWSCVILIGVSYLKLKEIA